MLIYLSVNYQDVKYVIMIRFADAAINETMRQPLVYKRDNVHLSK